MTDDTMRDILYALRGFKRAPLVAFTIVSTVALGLGLVAVAFTVLNALLFRVDAVPDVHEMFAVRVSGSERQPFTRAHLDALQRETDIFTAAYAEQSDVETMADGRLAFGTFVTGNFFQVLRVQAAIGRVLNPADDGPDAGEPAMVLSHRGWDRLFARDPAVVGRRLFLNGITFEVIGVMPEGFRGLTVAPDDYWAPLSMLGEVRRIPRERPPSRSSGEAGDVVGVGIVGRLTPGISRQAAVAQLAVWDARPSTELGGGRSTAAPTGASRITLVPRRGTVEQPLEVVPITAPLFFAFGLILLIGCANVASLLLARAVARQREIGIQLSLGATRHRIVRQLLTESLLLALFAAAAGFVISRVVLAVVMNALMTGLPPDIGDIRLSVPDADWRVLLFLIVGAIVSTMFFGLVPALQATRIEPLRTLRGDVVSDARPGTARNLLIALQVSASALLLICAAVFLRSAFAAARFDPGMRTSDTLVVGIANESGRNAIVQAVAAEPAVAAVAAGGTDAAAFAHVSGAKSAVTYKSVSAEYFDVLEIPVVRGRAFTAAEGSSNLSVAVVSDTTARTLWPNAEPIGQFVRIDPDAVSEPRGGSRVPFESRTFTVVGVVRDVAGFRIMPFKKAVVYVPTSAAAAGTSCIVRVRGDSEAARQTILSRLTAIDPDMARQVVTMRTLARLDRYFLEMAFWLTVVLGGLALALTLSGLFSVLSYLVEQRAKEIGVRMALGATTRDVTVLVLWQSIRPVALGLLVGTGAAAGLAAALLASPGAAGVGEIVHVRDPVAYAASVCIIIVACLAAASIPALRAAHLDPTYTLRRE